MTMIPMGGHKVSCNPSLVQNYPDAYLSMGLTAERLAQRFGITRQQADEFSYQSHQKALRAIESGAFADEIVPVQVTFRAPAAQATRGAAAVQARGAGHRIQGGRRPARRYHAGSSGRAQACVPCEGNGDCRKLLADERWRCRRRGDERRARRRLSDSSRWRALSPSPRRATSRRRWDSARSLRFPRR